MRIKEDWASRSQWITPEDVRIDQYFGTYNGKVALMISDNATSFHAAVWYEKVAGFVFHYGSGQRVLVWYNGNFFSLPEAYEQGLITAEDVENIFYFNRNSSPFIWQL